MIRWGVLGPGTIAAGFAEAMVAVDDGEIVAVCSRAMERADRFAERFDVERRYDDVEDFLDDPEVDVVYVATPQSVHHRDTLACLRAGKPALCEKPFALSLAQGQAMVDEARARGLFLMEAIWSRYLPSYRKLVEVLESGRIGEPLLVEADFGFRLPPGMDHRLQRADLGGGGLLDLGIYPVQLCFLVLGRPDRVVAEGVIGASGVDEQVAAVLHHPGGRLGIVKAAISVNLTCTGRIAGTEGVIELPAMVHCPMTFDVVTPDGRETIDGTYEGNGLRFEIAEVHRCLAGGETESPSMTLDETLALASVLDDIRAQIGLTFPDE